MSLALRRVLSKGGAHALTLALQVDVHRTTICRTEIGCRAALVACNRAWHKDMRTIMTNNCHTTTDDRGQGGYTSKWLFSLHCIRSDATNSSVWRKCKLHTTELDSSYQTSCCTSSTTAEDALNAIQRKKMFGDLQVMRDCSSAGNYAMVRKQIASIGGPTWGKLKIGPLRLPLEDQHDRHDGPLPVANEALPAAPTRYNYPEYSGPELGFCLCSTECDCAQKDWEALQPTQPATDDGHSSASAVPAGHSSASSGPCPTNAVVPSGVLSSGEGLHQQ